MSQEKPKPKTIRAGDVLHSGLDGGYRAIALPAAELGGELVLLPLPQPTSTWSAGPFDPLADVRAVTECYLRDVGRRVDV